MSFCFLQVGSETEISGKVMVVFDGNSLEVSTKENEAYRIVLLGIDCPELSQEYGREAALFTEKKLRGQEVVVRLYGKDRSKNYIGVVLFEGGTDLRLALLDAGLAWTAEKNPLAELESHRLQAEKEKRGLWGQGGPTPPWIHRRQQSMAVPKSR